MLETKAIAQSTSGNKCPGTERCLDTGHRNEQLPPHNRIPVVFVRFHLHEFNATECVGRWTAFYGTKVLRPAACVAITMQVGHPVPTDLRGELLEALSFHRCLVPPVFLPDGWLGTIQSRKYRPSGRSD